MPASARSRILVAVGLLIGILVIAMVGAIGVSAVTLPGCEGCHLTGAFGAASAATAHASTECRACHGGGTVAGRLTFANAQVFGMWLKVTDVDPTIAEVEPQKCLGCHSVVMERASEASGLRILHAACTVDRECGDCHSVTAHGAAVSWPRTVTMEMCFDCHGAGDVSDECDLCHQARLPKERIQAGSFAVTHGPNYLKTHGLARMTSCVPCHDSSKCQSCHGPGLPHGVGFAKKHGEAARAADARCTDCHLKQYCVDCHAGYEMPHPREVLLEHGATVKAEGEKACRRCHADPDCDECHIRHVHPTTTEQLENMGFGIPGAGR